MNKILITITTYNRPQLLLDLLIDIAKIPDVRVKVYDDGSTEDYSEVVKFLDGMDSYYVRLPHRGKEGFWKIHQVMYSEMRYENYDYFVQLLDDMRLVQGFYPKVIEQFKLSGADLLNIINIDALIEVMKQRKVKSYEVNGVKFWDYHWQDLCFITTRKYLENIQYTCPRVSKGWFDNPNASSGVSTALTKAFTGRISIVDRALLIHTGQKSQMKPHRAGYYSRL